MIYTIINFPGIGVVNDKLPETSPGQLISDILPYLFVAAGLILLLVIASAGFTMFTSAGNPEKTKKAGQQLTFGLIGFFLIFASYWIAKLLGSIFGISFLGT